MQCQLVTINCTDFLMEYSQDVVDNTAPLPVPYPAIIDSPPSLQLSLLFETMLLMTLFFTKHC